MTATIFEYLAAFREGGPEHAAHVVAGGRAAPVPKPRNDTPSTPRTPLPAQPRQGGLW
ncbi:MAG: hypothetical protein AB7I38_18705 [Dehalococcoidia bacterium]